MDQHIDRYVPADTNGGWGIAAGVVMLAVLLIVAVTMIHKRTYKHPTNVTWDSRPKGEGVAEATHLPAH
jgi:hypothetical protein